MAKSKRYRWQNWQTVRGSNSNTSYRVPTAICQKCHGEYRRRHPSHKLCPSCFQRHGERKVSSRPIRRSRSAASYNREWMTPEQWQDCQEAWARQER